MFNKRLQHDFEIPNAGLHRVYLLEESDTVVTWPVICGQGEPVRLTFGNRNNSIYTPILPGTLTWRIVIQNQAARDAIDAVFESIEGDYRVEFYQVEGGVTENLIWRGDLLLDQYNEDLRGFPGFVELIANDLASLQGKNYLHTDGFVHTGRETQLQIIKNCVQLLGYDLGFACSDAIFEDTMDGDPLVDDPMLQAYADNAWYYPVDQFGQTRLMSAWDVLSSILISKACRIRQWGGRWYVEQLVEGVEPLPLPDGNFLVGSRLSSLARLYNFDGTDINQIDSFFSGGVVIASYLPPDGSIIILGNPGNWRKYSAAGELVWERQLTSTPAQIERTNIVYSRYGYYAAMSGLDGGTRYVSCIDNAGNLVYELTLEGSVSVIGFDEALNLYVAFNQTLPVESYIRRFAINGGEENVLIFSGSNSAVQASAFDPITFDIIVRVQNQGFLRYGLDGEFIEGYGFQSSAAATDIPFVIDYDRNFIYRRADNLYEYRKFNPGTGTIIYTTELENTVTVNGLAIDTLNRVYAVGGSTTFSEQRYMRIVDTNGVEIGLVSGGAIVHRNVSAHPGPSYPLIVPPTIIPPAPQDLVATADAGTEGAVDLVWVTPPSKTTISGYRIYQDNVLIQTVAFLTNSFKVTGLSLDVEYAFKVASYNTAGESNFSNIELITLSAAGSGSTDFSEYTTGVIPSDWTGRYNAGNWIVAVDAGYTGGKALRSSGSGTGLRVCTWNDKDFENGTVKMRGKPDSSWPAGTWALACVARVSGATEGAANMYAAAIIPAGFRIYKIVGGTVTPLDTVVKTPSTGVMYNFEFTLDGTSLTAKIYTDAEGVAGGVSLSATDSDVTGSGFTGVSTYVASNMFYDTFEVGVA